MRRILFPFSSFTAGMLFVMSVSAQAQSSDGETAQGGGTPPVITCPSSMTVECTGALTPVTYTATAKDFSGNPLPVTCMPPSGSGFRLGPSNVVCSATDTAGRSSSCSFTVTVVDTRPPSVTCSTNRVVSTSGAGAVVTYIASASDACDIGSFQCLPPSGSTFPLGTTTVLCKAADSVGNSNGCTFTVTVQAATPPVITCPSGVSKECTGGLTPVTYTATAVDGSGNPLAVICVPPSGTLFRIGTSNVVCTATDTTGASSSCSFIVTVVDTTPPTVICNSNITATATSTNGAAVSYVAQATDQCGIRSLVCLPPGNVFPIGTTTVTCTAVDGVGNTNACTFTVTVTSLNQCPTAVAKVSPNVQLLPGQTDTIVISANGSNACVTLDGTMSSDPDGDALTYTWTVSLDGSQLLSGATTNTCLELGTHDVTLAVSDGQCTNTQTVTVDVLTPCEAEGALLILIQSSSLPRNVQQSLVSSVKAACASFERFGINSGVNQLQAFKSKVRTHVRTLDLALAYQLEGTAQAIIDALTGP